MKLKFKILKKYKINSFKLQKVLIKKLNKL